jgi:fructose-1,6-bisphosphatase/inositol monophosphatase family enzyme
LDLIETVTALLKHVADQEILPRFRNLADHERMDKGGNDVVTAADHASEAILAAALAKLTPNALIVGEEAAHADPSLLEKLKDAELAWVFDPLDGTRNFAEGREDFAVMAALLKGDEPVLGWIHQPITGLTAVAERGAGAMIDGRKIHIHQSDATDLSEMIGEFHYGFLPAELRDPVKAAKDHVATRRPRFCAGTTYVNLVRDPHLFAFYYRLLPWDHAPGSLIYREAGGVAASFDRSPYRPTAPSKGLLLAPNERIWGNVQKLLFPSIQIV